MHNHRTFGQYFPSSVLITLETDKPILNIRELDQGVQRTYLHEYTHFLQYISGGFGYTHIWNTYDRALQIISHLQKSDEKELKIAYSHPVVEEQRVNFKARQAIEGDFNVRNMEDSSAKIIEMRRYKDVDFGKIYQGTPPDFVEVRLQDRHGDRSWYRFGESAVSESMAYLMERKFFGDFPLNEFPYNACWHLGAFMNSDICRNDEWLFALCDVAMLSTYPGLMFFIILDTMIGKKFTPGDTKEIYEVGINIMHENGWWVWEDLEKNKNGAVHMLKTLFNHPFFEPTLQWLTGILENGFEERRKNPAFMLDLYREKESFSGRWDWAAYTFGTPHSTNNVFDRAFSAPYGMREMEPKIDPIFLLALQQIQDILLKGQDFSRCSLLPYCRKSTNGLKTDERCENAPWERSSDEQACAFAALWVTYGLDKFAIRL